MRSISALGTSGAATTMCVLFVLTGCGGDDSPDDPDSGDASADAAPSFDARPSCDRAPAPADRTRHVVISLPFATMDGDTYEVLALDTAGALTRPGTTFQMHRAFLGKIAFTPDGEIGVVAQDDGTLGVFRIDEAGDVTVVHDGYDSSGDDDFYADSVVMHPDGQRVYVLNSQWRKYGGGVWEVYIGCDGTLDPARLVAAAKLPYALALTDDSATAVVAAKDMLDLPAGDTSFLVDLAEPPAVIASAAAFVDIDATISDIALSADGSYALIADNGLFSANSVARVGVGDSTLTAEGTLAMFDPIGVVTSPFDSTAIVITGEGDAFHYVDGEAFAAFTEMTYVGASPQLPGPAVMIERGTLRGRVLVGEIDGVRQVDFVDAGPPVDVGLTSLGDTPGVIGVQP